MLISPLALYNYNNTIFATIKPLVPNTVSADDVINAILLETAELEVLYPNPDTFITAITIWGKSRYKAWQRVSDALTAEYSPIENTDRYEDITDTTEVTGNEKTTDTRTGTANVDVIENTKFKEGDKTSTSSVINSVTGFNADSFVNNNKAENNGTSTHAEDSTSAESNTTSTTSNINNIGRDNTEKRVYKHVNHTHGNIGVTTSQYMISEEVKLRLENDVIHFIVNDFKQNFCILVY